MLRKAMFLFFLVPCIALCGQGTLTNESVVKLVKAGFGAEMIVTMVKAQPSNFSLTPDDVIALKNQQVPEQVIAAMIAKGAGADKPTAPSVPPPANPNVPEDIGVYAQIKGSLVEVNAEIINWKSGGVGKSLLTMGFTKGHINAAVAGPKSKLQTVTPLEFVVKCPEGVTPSEYQLLKLDQKDDRREFRAVTGGVYHSSGGAEKNAVKFDFQKIASRTYKIILADLKKGEYGLLPPGGASVGGVGGGASGQTVQGGSMQAGRLYTFGIIE